MPVPWQALIPPALMTTMFAITGTLLNITARARNQGKPPRYNIDAWDGMMMIRDEHLTGHPRGQKDDVIAPPNFNHIPVPFQSK